MMNGGETTASTSSNVTTSSSATSSSNDGSTMFDSAEYKAVVKRFMEIEVIPKMHKLAFKCNWLGVIERCTTHPHELQSLPLFQVTPLAMILFMYSPEILTQPDAVKCICTMARVAPETVVFSCPDFMNKSPISMIWSMIATERLTKPVLLQRQELDASAVADMILKFDNDTSSSSSSKVHNHRSEALVEILLKFIRGLKFPVMIPILQTTFYNVLSVCQMPVNDKGTTNGITQIDQQLITGIYFLYSCLVQNVPKYLNIISDFDRQVCEDIKQTFVHITIYDEQYLKQDKHDAAPSSTTAELSKSLLGDNNNSLAGKKKSAGSNAYDHGVIPLSKLHDISKEFDKANVASGEENTTTSLHVAFQNYKRHKNQTPPPHIIYQTIKLFPHWLHMKDTDGFIPLHYICQNATWFRSNVTYIKTMLSTDKTIAQIKTPAGEYPYVFALENKINPSEEGMKTLLDAYPEVLETINAKTKLYPFMTVALRQPFSWMNMGRRLESCAKISETYTLLRQMPEVLSQHIEKTSTTGCATTTSITANESRRQNTFTNSFVFILSVFVSVGSCIVAIILHQLMIEADVL